MQFNRTEHAGQTIAKFEFFGLTKLRPMAQRGLFSHFARLGGQEIPITGDWVFPSFITSQVIQTIIHNTCFVCGGLMQDSEVQNGGISPAIKVRKCTSCGHSHT